MLDSEYRSVLFESQTFSLRVSNQTMSLVLRSRHFYKDCCSVKCVLGTCESTNRE